MDAPDGCDSDEKNPDVIPQGESHNTLDNTENNCRAPVKHK